MASTSVKQQFREVCIDQLLYTEVTENQAKILFPSDHKVFYNPVQEFNRDFSIAIIQQFADCYAKSSSRRQRKRDAAARGTDSSRNNCSSSAVEQDTRERLRGDEQDRNNNSGIKILEALAASGLRSIRYAKEISAVREVIANDFSQQAVEAIRRNIKYNDVEHIVQPSHADASLLLYQSRQQPFDVIDLDPFGSPHLFLDGAVQAVAEGGLLLVTCTDMAVLCGNSPETCWAKYGATSLKTKACHEMALRIVLQSLDAHANRYGRYIEPLVSISADFYIRVAVRVFSSPLRVKQSYTKVGMVYHCVGCGTTITEPLGHVEVQGKSVRYKLSSAPALSERCRHCRARHQIAGPVWLAPLHDQQFLRRLIERVSAEGFFNGPTLSTQRRMLGMLKMQLEELPDVPLYYLSDRLCSVVGTTACKLQLIQSALLNAGYRVSGTHCNKLGVKTNAPASVVWDVIRAHEQLFPATKTRKLKDSPGLNILSAKSSITVDFMPHPEAVPESRQGDYLRFQVNPTKYWGPACRGTSTGAVCDAQQEKMQRNQGRRFRRRKLKNKEAVETQNEENDFLLDVERDSNVNNLDVQNLNNSEIDDKVMKRVKLD